MGAGAGGWRGGVEESIEGCPGGMGGPAGEQKRDKCTGTVYDPIISFHNGDTG